MRSLREAFCSRHINAAFRLLFRARHHRACPFRHCGLDRNFLEHPSSFLTFVFSCHQPGPVRMFKFCTGVWFQVDVMSSGDDLFQASFLRACKPRLQPHDILSYGLFLNADGDVLSLLFRTEPGFLGAVLVRADKIFGILSPLLRLE